MVGNIFNNLHAAEANLKTQELNFDATGSVPALVALNASQASYLRALADEEEYWKQRARSRWLKEGDRNTKFFHAATLEKRTRLRISTIKDATSRW